MSAFISVLRLMFSLLPGPVQVFILAVIGLVLLVLVLKIVATVLNSIPFL